MQQSGVEQRESGIELSVPPVAVAACAIAVAVLATRDSLGGLVARWNEAGGGNSHGYLVAAAVPVLVWLRRERLYFEPRGRGVAALALLATVIAYVFARTAHVELAAWAVLPLLAMCACAVALGPGGARAAVAPLACLWFAIPLGVVLTPPLQWLTVHASTSLLALAGVPAFIQGDVVTVAGGTFQIAGGCSGTSYFVIGLATAAIVGLAQDMPRRRLLRLAAAAAAAAILANWLRVAIIIAIGDATAMQSSLVADHAQFGWWVFAAALVPVVRYARRLTSGPSPGAPTARRPSSPDRRAPAWAVVALATLCIAPAWIAGVERLRPMEPRPALPAGGATLAAAAWAMPTPAAGETPTAAAGETPRPAAGATDWWPNFPGATASRATYAADGAEVLAHVATYVRQSAGRELVGEFSSIAGDGWSIAESGVTSVAPGADRVIETVLVRGSRDARLVWWWYEVRGRRVTSGRAAKLLEGLGAFAGPRPSAAIALSTRCHDANCDAARIRLATAYAHGLGQVSAGTGAR